MRIFNCCNPELLPRGETGIRDIGGGQGRTADRDRQEVTQQRDAMRDRTSLVDRLAEAKARAIDDGL